MLGTIPYKNELSNSFIYCHLFLLLFIFLSFSFSIFECSISFLRLYFDFPKSCMRLLEAVIEFIIVEGSYKSVINPQQLDSQNYI